MKNQFNTVSATVNEWIDSNIITNERDGKFVLDLNISDMNMLPVCIFELGKEVHVVAQNEK